MRDSLIWEEYLRKTARMEAVAVAFSVLALPFRVQHGMRVVDRGEPLDLSHVVTGPTGIFLVESVDRTEENWRKELTRKIAFFRELLGSDAAHFTCLVIPHEFIGDAPDGALLVDSPEIARGVITQSTEPPIRPALLQEVRSVLAGLSRKEAGREVETVGAPPAQPAAARRANAARLGWITILAAIIADTSCTAATVQSKPDADLWWAGLFVVVAPAAALVGISYMLPWERVRQSIAYTIMFVMALTFIISALFLVKHAL